MNLTYFADVFEKTMSIIKIDHVESIEPLSSNKLHDLMPSQSGTIELETKVVDYIIAATSQNTRKAYRHDIQHFMTWGGLLPATPESIVNYLQYYAEKLNPHTLTRCSGLISSAHGLAIIAHFGPRLIENIN